MGDLIQLRRRGAASAAYRLLAVTPMAGAYRPPNIACPECQGVGWIQREPEANRGVPSVIICDCMKKDENPEGGV